MSFAIVVVSFVPGKDIPNEKTGLQALRLSRYTGKQMEHYHDLYYPEESTLKQVEEYIEDYREHGLQPDEEEPSAA